MIKSDCEGNKEMDPPDSRTNLLSRYLEEFVLSVQAPPTNLKWPDSGSDSMLSHYAHPKLCQAPCSSNSDEYRSIHSVSSPDEVLDLSTRSESETYSTIGRNQICPSPEDDAQTEKPIRLYDPVNISFGNPCNLNPIRLFESALSWLPSYQLLLATKEYMDIFIQKSTTRISTSLMPQSESAMTHDFSNPLFSRFARSYWDHLHGSKQGKSLTESEANYRCTNLDTPYSSSPCQSKKSTLSNSLVLSGSVNDSILNPLFGGTLNNPVNRYSPPLNFSAFTSFDQNMICPICRKCFRFEKNLLRHLQKTHATGTGESVLKCKLCNYTTRHYSNMYVHIRTHTGDKPYSCSACGVSFTQGSSLKLHIRSRHEDNAKYFSLTRKPGKNNLTKLWTRVLKKDLPKYNSVMANTLLNRSKFWSRPDPIQLNPFGLVQSKLLPVDINLPGSNQFGWNSSTPASVMPTPFKSVNRLNYAQSSKSTQNHVQRNGTGSSVDGFETELPGLDVVRDTESSHTSARFVNRETADDIFRPAGWPMDRKRRVRRQKTEQTELSTVMDGDKAGNISCSVEGYQNNKAYMSYLTKTEGLSPRRDDSYVAPHLYNCERGQEISNRSVCRATVPADWIERESSALFSSPQPKASHYSRSDYVLHEKRDSEQSDFKHYPESGPRTAGLTQPLSNPDTTRQHY